MTDDPAVMVGEWLGMFATNTRKAYQAALTQWLEHCTAAGLDPLTVSTEQCGAYYQYRRATGEKPATSSARIRAISSWYGHLVETERIGRNPWHRVKVIKPSTERTTRFLTAEQTRQVLDYAATKAGASHHAFVRVLAITGVRLSEALAFQIERLEAVAGEWRITFRSKGGQDRTITLDDGTVDAIRAAIGGRTTGWVFTAGADRAWSTSTGYKTALSMCTAAGVPAVSPHGWRRGAITAVLEQTGDLKMARDFAGHADVGTTAGYDRRDRLQQQGTAAVLTATGQQVSL